ncbi:hypothetical protein GIB67_033157, partial [Kingdonia uniflora]
SVFLFLGSVEGFSSKLQPCTFNKDKMCKSALAHAAFSTVAFVLGAITSVISGFHGMKITTYANARTTLEARKCVGKAFITAFRYGAVMGFLLSANGLLVLYITINVFKLYYGDAGKAFLAIIGYRFFEIIAVKEIEPALKHQLIISTALMTIGIALLVARPSTFLHNLQFWSSKNCKELLKYVTNLVTFTSYCGSVQDVADSCRIGAATNVIFGLALGYKSVIILIFAIALSIFVSFNLAAMYGIAVATLGMLSTIATGLAIDAYGPISDNAGGIVEMASMSHRVRERTDALEVTGSTTAAIGKGFAIGSAALVSLALFGAL